MKSRFDRQAGTQMIGKQGLKAVVAAIDHESLNTVDTAPGHGRQIPAIYQGRYSKMPKQRRVSGCDEKPAWE